MAAFSFSRAAKKWKRTKGICIVPPSPSLRENPSRGGGGGWKWHGSKSGHDDDDDAVVVVVEHAWSPLYCC